jgi:hypothetical protein
VALCLSGLFLVSDEDFPLKTVGPDFFMMLSYFILLLSGLTHLGLKAGLPALVTYPSLIEEFGNVFVEALK